MGVRAPFRLAAMAIVVAMTLDAHNVGHAAKADFARMGAVKWRARHLDNYLLLQRALWPRFRAWRPSRRSTTAPPTTTTTTTTRTTTPTTTRTTTTTTTSTSGPWPTSVASLQAKWSTGPLTLALSKRLEVEESEKIEENESNVMIMGLLAVLMSCLLLSLLMFGLTQRMQYSDDSSHSSFLSGSSSVDSLKSSEDAFRRSKQSPRLSGGRLELNPYSPDLMRFNWPESTGSDSEDDDTVYECPGLAKFEQMEVRNPFFLHNTEKGQMSLNLHHDSLVRAQ